MTASFKRQSEPELMDLPEEAAAYAAADFSAVNQAFADRLIELSGDSPRMEAIDLGCGPADIPLRIWRARPGWRIIALDASAAMLELGRAAIASAGAGSEIRFVQADAKSTGLAGGAFDLIFSNSILHHVSDPALLWNEMKRLARPGAMVFLRDLHRPASDAASAEIVRTYAGEESALLQEEFYRSLNAAYTLAEVKVQLEAAGLGQLRIDRSSDRHLDVWGRL